jgi:hypothetical protein
MAPALKDLWKDARIAAVLATVALVSACVAPQHSLQQVSAESPSVTYAYSGDDELLQASQNAAAFCRQYTSTPEPARITTTSSGAKSAVFVCNPNPAPVVVPQQAVVVPQPMPAGNLTYSYQSDEELLAASRTADAYCANTGLHGVVSSITPNTDGSKIVTFQCARG